MIQLRWWIFCTCRFLFSSAQRIWWQCNGTANTLRRARKGQLYEQSAQVKNIIWKCKLDPTREAQSDKFIATHSHFAHPRCILEKNITLIYVDEKEALFVETPRTVDIYSSELNPFMYMAQFDYAARLIVLPITSFHRIADEIGDPKGDVLLLSNTGRCGSTVVTQILESVPRVLCMSEPGGYTSLNIIMKQTSREEFERHVKSVVRLTCKPLRVSNPRLICIKPRAENFIFANIVARAVPKIKHLFLYRNGKETVQSYYHAFASLPQTKRSHALQTSRIAHYLFPRLARFLWDLGVDTETYPWLGDTELVVRVSIIGYYVASWATICANYRRFKQNGMAIKAFKYEDLIGKTHYACKQLLQYCDLPVEYASEACKAMDRDSQRGMYVTNLDTLGKRGRSYLIDWTKDVQSEADLFCDRLGVARIGERGVLPDTVSSNGVKC